MVVRLGLSRTWESGPHYEALADVVRAVAHHRRDGAPQHPLNQLAASRRLRARLLANPALVGAAALVVVQRVPGVVAQVDAKQRRRRHEHMARGHQRPEVAHEERSAGDSKYSMYKLLRLNFDLMTGFSNAPLQLFSLIGIAISLLSFAFVVFLASDESSFSTGSEFVVDGGLVEDVSHKG